ncbi:Ectopic P granules protein 5 like protein [Myotis davidii]|uniref:Proline-serine-threonine phosphatase-interacting protein 2 n=1 Tax=Myotis davidii TaxID=225400 RepID=L5M435_MYODS|nr:Ectopic P granules protein 5 like protein [Myotis davidii]
MREKHRSAVSRTLPTPDVPAIKSPDILSTIGYDSIIQHLNNGRKNCKEFEDFLKERASIEERYGKDLLNLSRKKPCGQSEINTLKRSLEVFKQQVDNVAQCHIQLAQTLREEARKLEEFREKQKLQRKKTELIMDAVHKQRSLQFKKTMDAKKNYEQKCRDKDDAEQAVHRSANLVNPKQQEKLFVKLATAKTAAEDSDKAYMLHINTLDKVREEWQSEHIKACEALEAQEYERINFFRNSLWLHVNQLSKQCVTSDEMYEEVRKSLEMCSIEQDIEYFVNQRKTGQMPPGEDLSRFLRVYQEKKKYETLQREEFDEVSLANSSRELEIPTPTCELTGDHPKVLTDSELQNDAHGQDESEMFDVQLSSLTINNEGSLTWNAETLKEGEGVGACVGGDAVKLKVDPGDNVGTKEMENLQVRETQHSKEDKQASNLSSEVLQNVGLQSSCEAMDIFQPPRVKKLYPQLPAEIAEVPALVAPKPLLRNERLYPELPSQPEVVPFTKEQLKIFEPGSWLENVESYLEEFDSMAHQDRHEFYELLLNYSRCRKQLLLAEAELFALTSDCQNAKSRLWHFKEEQLSVQGICADQVKVSGYHRYQRVEMSENALGELKKLFDAKSEHLHQTLALHSYTSVLSRLQVESYIYTLLNSSAVLRSLAVHQQGRASKQAESIPSDLCQLKECISVLFMFTRRVNEDTQFRDDILLWLQKLVSVLQRAGCLGDQLFLLNHILRCPAGVSKWAVPFIQIKVLSNPSGVFHFMQSLALLMSPVKNRAEFLCHMKPSEGKPSTSGPASGSWTLVDEGGEEDEDPETGWILLNEDDLVILFSQFPFHELFQHLLGFKAKGRLILWSYVKCGSAKFKHRNSASSLTLVQVPDSGSPVPRHALQR